MASPELDPQAVARGFGTTWQRVVTDPRGFFSEMSETGGLGEPCGFLAICAGAAAVGRFLTTLRPWSALGTGLSILGGGFVVAALLVLVAQHLFDGRAGFEPVFRVVAYAAAPAAFGFVPLVGPLAIAYGWFLMVRGVERVQEFDPTRATLTVLVGVLVAGLACASCVTGLVPALR